MAEIVIDEVQPRAQAALSNSPFYELRDLHVEHRDGTLCISGCVSSFYHKQIARRLFVLFRREPEVINSIRVELQEDGNFE